MTKETIISSNGWDPENRSVGARTEFIGGIAVRYARG
jgi:hypothetical protein